MSDGLMIIGKRPSVVARVEIARSFSYKMNLANYGGAPYESHDFFCSEKAECALEDAEDISEMLYQFCKSQVRLAVKEFLAEKERRRAS